MAMQVPLANDKKRVKVYELRDNDWFDRGTGFCTGQIINDEPRIYVESEDQPDRMLLETRIIKEDGYQKQQDTLIVWTETNGTDMALSFQEADGCAAIWEFVSHVQSQLLAMAPDDALSDDAMESFSNPIMLPPPDLSNLPEIEQVIRAASSTQAGRDALAKFVIREDYIPKLIPCVELAEDLESLHDLHRMCNIMKSLILLNDNTIIEHVVTDGVIIGVVGALEYDPDFPTHKANHRQYLSDSTRYKEVVPIKDPVIKKKIRHTWRLQYLKDVVLARILDDPTFSVLNSLIFFNQVDIVQHLQANGTFLKELFAVFDVNNTNTRRKEDAVHFLHQCAAIAKNLQAPARANLFSNFITHGLFVVITFAIKHPNPSMRTTGIDILVALLDHDPAIMRSYMLRALMEKKIPLTDTLIELLHAETDLGVKSQLADAIKVLLDPQAPLHETLGGNRPGAEFMSKLSRPPQITPSQAANEQFAQDHFDRSCKKLFSPLIDLETRTSMEDFTYQEVALYSHLVEILTFFVRQHSLRSRQFVLSENLPPRVAQLLSVLQKPLKLTALKFFRTCVSLQDQFYATQVTQNNTLDLILDIVVETMPRDNLLNSACLELFEFIKRENIKAIILHVVENYRERLKDITYVDTFQNLILRYEQMQGYNPEMEQTLFSQEDDTPPDGRNHVNGSQRWQGLKDLDSNEEEYFNTSDDDDDERTAEELHQDRTRDVSEPVNWHHRRVKAEMTNGKTSPLAKSLVDYPDDEEEDGTDTKPVQRTVMVESEKENTSPDTRAKSERRLQPSPEITSTANTQFHHPPERMSEKRRREEDEEEDADELVKLSSGVKRRNSLASSTSSSPSTVGTLRRRKSFLRSKQVSSDASSTNSASPIEKEPVAEHKRGKKIAISLTNSAAKSKESTPESGSGVPKMSAKAEEDPDRR